MFARKPNLRDKIDKVACNVYANTCSYCVVGLLYMLDEEMKDAVSDLTAALNFQ